MKITGLEAITTAGLDGSTGKGLECDRAGRPTIAELYALATRTPVTGVDRIASLRRRVLGVSQVAKSPAGPLQGRPREIMEGRADVMRFAGWDLAICPGAVAPALPTRDRRES